jgi:hypothetical protein
MRWHCDEAPDEFRATAEKSLGESLKELPQYFCVVDEVREERRRLDSLCSVHPARSMKQSGQRSEGLPAAQGAVDDPADYFDAILVVMPELDWRRCGLESLDNPGRD